MKSCNLWLGLAAVAWFAATTVAAPAPAPESQGPISDILRLREKLPKTAPPQVTKVAVRNDTLEMERQRIVLVPYVVEEKVRDGEVEKIVTRTGYKQEVYSQRVAVATKNCKFFTVTKEGTLEAVETEKAAAQLKKPMAVLLGDTSEVDPRHLELVKPGTLYLIVPPSGPPPLIEEPLRRE